MKGANIMRKSKKVLALLLAASVFSTTFMSNGMPAKADIVTNVEESEGTLSLDPADLTHGTGLDEKDLEEIAAEAEKTGDSADEKIEEAIAAQAAGELPAAVDNSTGENGKYFPAIGNQGSIGSCLAWADKYYNKTYMFNKYFDRAVDDSNTFSPKWGHANVGWLKGSLTLDRCPNTNFTSSGGMLGNDFYADCEADYMEAELGATDANVYILGGKTREDKDIQTDGVDSSDIAIIKQCLANGSILQLGTYAYWFNYSNIDGTLTSENSKYANQRIIVACANNSTSKKGGHAMNIVGYDDGIGVDLNNNGVLEAGEMGAFKVVNSWGASWGNSGFVWMAYDSFNAVSKYSAIGTGEGEERVSIADYVAEIILEDDRMEKYINHEEPAMYYQINCTAEDKGLYFGSVNQYGTAYYHENHTLSVGGESAFRSGVNYRGKRDGACEVTFIKSVRNYWATYDKYFLHMSYSGKKESASLDKIVFVNNKEKKAYRIKQPYTTLTKDETYIIHDRKEYTLYEVPYISSMDVNFVNGQITVAAAAKDSAGNIKYDLSYESEAVEDAGSLTQNTTGQFAFTPNASGYYRVKLTATDKNGETNTKTKLIKVNVDPLQAEIKSVSSGNPFSYVNMKVEGGTAPYTYSYVYTRKSNGQEYDRQTDREVSLYNENLFGFTINTDEYAPNHGAYPSEGFSGVGTNHLNVVVKDANGKTCTVETDIEVEPFEITEITSNLSSPQKMGAEIQFNALSKNRFNGYCSRVPLGYRWEITNILTGEAESFFVVSASPSCNWTPSKAGRYLVKVSANDVNYSEKTMEFDIVGDKTTVYYANSNWDNAYIHYKTQNGQWTNVPGVKMEASDVGEYTWKFDIQLAYDNSENVQVCFNNGNGDWDSRNGQNYFLNKGTYGIKNGNVEELGFKVTLFTIDKPMIIGLGDQNIKFIAEAGFGSGDYSYRFGTIFNGVKYYSSDSYGQYNTYLGSLSSIMSVQYPYHSIIGTHTLFVEAKDNITGEIATKTIENFVVKPLAIKSFTSNASSNVIKVGTPVTLTAETEYEVGYRYNTYKFTAIKDGVRKEIDAYNYWSHYSKTWTPTEPGNYTIEYYVHDGCDQTATATLEFTVVDTNTTTLYYNNNNWSQAYVHYCINGGQWTSVPGVKMADSTEQDGYRWKFDFDLGEADGVTVCFTDGNGNWDSRNASNYYIGTGTYGIKDGSVTEIN